jgi:DNA-binding NarL/FixJ family response regulator
MRNRSFAALTTGAFARFPHMNVKRGYRVSVRRMDQPELRTRAEAALVRSTIARIDETEPEVVLTNGDRDAIAAAAPSAPHVVAILPEADRRLTWAALDAGAHAVVLESDLAALDAAVQAVCSGFIVVPTLARRALSRPVLSSREKQVLSMVVIGLTNGEIAGRLHLAESTVKSHLSAIFEKLDVRSRKEAADVVLDPRSGLGPGILAITPSRGLAAYTQPVVQ